MRAGTVRIRFDRKTGQELDREILEEFELSDDVYAEKLVMAMTGKGPASAAKEIIQKLENEGLTSIENKKMNSQIVDISQILLIKKG